MGFMKVLKSAGGVAKAAGGLGLAVGDLGITVVSEVGKAACTGIKFAANAALDATAAQGGPNYRYKLYLSNQISSRHDLNECVEQWVLSYMRGMIGSRDPYFMSIKEKLENFKSNDGQLQGFVRSVDDSDVVLFPQTDEVQKFSLRAILVTGDQVLFDVSCSESAHINQYVLRGF